jgi:hypothetical protein
VRRNWECGEWRGPLPQVRCGSPRRGRAGRWVDADGPPRRALSWAGRRRRSRPRAAFCASLAGGLCGVANPASLGGLSDRDNRGRGGLFRAFNWLRGASPRSAAPVVPMLPHPRTRGMRIGAVNAAPSAFKGLAIRPRRGQKLEFSGVNRENEFWSRAKGDFLKQVHARVAESLLVAGRSSSWRGTTVTRRAIFWRCDPDSARRARDFHDHCN